MRIPQCECVIMPEGSFQVKNKIFEFWVYINIKYKLHIKKINCYFLYVLQFTMLIFYTESILKFYTGTPIKVITRVITYYNHNRSLIN